MLERDMEKNPPAFVQVDTKNRAGLMQSLGALVNTTFARLRITFFGQMWYGGLDPTDFIAMVWYIILTQIVYSHVQE